MESEEKAQQESTLKSESMAGKSGTAAKEDSPGVIAKHWKLFVILFLVLAMIGMYFWKNMAVGNVRTEISKKATEVISEQNKSYLRLVSIPLVWAVRSEMIRNNYDQINQYIASFVKEKNMKELVVARIDGKVVAATNKKLEGANISTSFPADVLQAEETTITIRENGDYQVVSPVMGLNAKLGVLVLVYAPPAFVVQ